jgi:hypothetical protein
VGGTEAAAGRNGRARFLLERLGPDGRVDPGFAPRGRVATRFGPPRVHAAKLLIDSQGRAVMVGAYRGRSRGSGLVVARYVLGGAG